MYVLLLFILIAVTDAAMQKFEQIPDDPGNVQSLSSDVKACGVPAVTTANRDDCKQRKKKKKVGRDDER